MITETEGNLIDLLKACGLDKDTTIAITTLCKTDENRRKMIDLIIQRYDQTGEVTEQYIQKVGLYLTGDRKSPDMFLTMTEAQQSPMPTEE